MLSASLLFACSESEDDVTPEADETVTATGITLSSYAETLDIDSYVTLVATLEPSGAEGTITWASSDSSVAAVGSESGTVMGVAEGTANIVATCGSLTATCVVTVNGASLHASLTGSDYYLIALDATTYEEIADKVVADLRVDDINSCLYVWWGYEASASTSGVNAYGLTESWTSLQVYADAGWSGLGYCYGVSEDYTALNALSATTDAASEYYLHVAFKATTAVSHMIKMESVGSGVCVVGNNGSMYDGDVEYPVNYELTSDGEWNHFDIPMTVFTEQGFAYNPANEAAANTFILLSGGVEGTPLDYDAVFIYKK